MANKPLYIFKHKPEDFIVEEILDFTFTEQGDVLYVYFEKRDKNTMDIVWALGKKFWFPRKAFGIAWLKDKQAVTRQRICIYKSYLDKIGWEQQFINELKKHTKVLKTHRHDQPMGVGKNAGNAFHITLRANQKINSIHKQEIITQLTNIQKKWFPNCFGVQRFGKGMRNYQRARDIIEGRTTINNDFELKFKLQGYGSARFNTYALDRRDQKQRLLDGDIVINKYNAYDIQTGVVEGKTIKLFDHKKCKELYAQKDYLYPDYFTQTIPLDTKKRIPTWPIIGINIMLPPQGTPARIQERNIFKKINFFLWKAAPICRQYKLYGIRRWLWVYPEKLTYHFEENNDLILSFSLPTGAYATTLLGILFETIDPAWCEANKRIIPHLQ